MHWWHAVAERDHELQNPTSAEKLTLLGDLLRLTPESRVLDMAAGKCGPATVLASAFGCRVTAVERAPEFVAAARVRVEAAGLGDRIEIHQADARDHPLREEAFDVALCLGATFVWGGLEGTLAALVPAVRAGGHVAVGECFWRHWPVPRGVDEMGFVALEETCERVAAAGLALVGLIESSADDWDRYESLHWRAVEDWLAENPHDPQAGEFGERLEEERERYLRTERGLLGWALLAGRRPALDGSRDGDEADAG